ncbi:MAG: secondary thiamine-phosphate synthase enzyme YjbQ [Candidatus Micrarchaeota archaeon]
MFTIRTNKKMQLVDITDNVRESVGRKKFTGICHIYLPHATAGLMINEFEPRIEQDFQTVFERVLPNVHFEHDEIDDNASAHLLSGLVGCEVSVPVKDGALTLGTWQRIILCEFDGPRERTVFINLIPGERV